MAIPFSQSTRALSADRGIPSIIGLIIAIALCTIWAAWFFYAPITRYATGTIVGATREGNIIAEFAAQELESIRPGQSAYIRLHGSEDSLTGSILGMVSRIIEPASSQLSKDSFSVLLFAQGDVAAAEIEAREFAGVVEIEVETVSPAMLVARASGQFVDTPSLSLGPQSRP